MKSEKKKKLLKLKKKPMIIIFIFFLLAILLTIFYINIHGIASNLKVIINGKKTVTLEVNSKYKDMGVTVKYNNKKISKNIKVKSSVNTKKVGKYKVIYTAKYKYIKKKVVRIVNIVDTTKPDIKLEGDNITIIVGNDYTEPGYSASDNYDGDITDKVKITNNLDTTKLGEYEIVYSVEDSSKNSFSISRKVTVVEKPKTIQKVAVLNYHFFYDPDIGESCDLSICEKVSDFKAQLNYLRDNNYKTLTMKEFRDWMYGIIEIPEKSVLITIDDGAMGTGKDNGNQLIPILEEYKMHATLFLITGWWSIENYRSEYLDIESHTNDMHVEGLCSGVTRGAQMLCSTDEQVRNDLKTSISITKSSLAFCFPFYAYNDNAINLVKEAGFDLAFIGGNYKASRNVDKYHIPRYPIQKTTSLDTFISYVSN